jgi:RHS repeat-associated protein
MGEYGDGETYHLPDAQGNVNAALDEAGDVMGMYKYQAFGLAAVAGATPDEGWSTLSTNDWAGLSVDGWANLPIMPGGGVPGMGGGFAQKQYYLNPETELYLLGGGGNGTESGGRQYDPRTGQFTSEDPIRQSGGDNLSGYAGNDPVNRNDPSGRDPNWEQFIVPASQAQALANAPRPAPPPPPKKDTISLAEALKDGRISAFERIQLVLSDGEITAIQQVFGLEPNTEASVQALWSQNSLSPGTKAEAQETAERWNRRDAMNALMMATNRQMVALGQALVVLGNIAIDFGPMIAEMPAALASPLRPRLGPSAPTRFPQEQDASPQSAPLKNRSGDIEASADAARSQPRYDPSAGGTPVTRTTEPDDVYHATTTAGRVQSVLDAIDPKFLDPNARFGRAFYAADLGDTAIAEVVASGETASHVIRFSVSTSAKILDLTDPVIAKAWGYSRGPITAETQAIGQKAIAAGFDAIRFPSERGLGNNLAVLKNYNNVLAPQMVAPASR